MDISGATAPLSAPVVATSEAGTTPPPSPGGWSEFSRLVAADACLEAFWLWVRYRVDPSRFASHFRLHYTSRTRPQDLQIYDLLDIVEHASAYGTVWCALTGRRPPRVMLRLDRTDYPHLLALIEDLATPWRLQLPSRLSYVADTRLDQLALADAMYLCIKTLTFGRDVLGVGSLRHPAAWHDLPLVSELRAPKRTLVPPTA